MVKNNVKDIIPLNVEFDNTAAVPLINMNSNMVVAIHLLDGSTAKLAEFRRLRRCHLTTLMLPPPPPVSSSLPLSPPSKDFIDQIIMLSDNGHLSIRNHTHVYRIENNGKVDGGLATVTFVGLPRPLKK